MRRPPPPEVGQNAGEWELACGCFLNFTLYNRDDDDDDADAFAAYDVEAVKVPLTISWKRGGGIKGKRGRFFILWGYTKG